MDIYKLKRILQRYHEGKANETENALIEAWYSSYTIDELLVKEDEMAEIRESIRLNIRAVTLSRSIIFRPVFRIAASVIIFSAIAVFAWRLSFHQTNSDQDYTTIITGTKDLKELTLSDGSLIWLNAASRIKVPPTFKGHLREVVLEEGEAFFSIKHDPQHPFIVHTSSLNVQVLGTSFNIKAYKSLQTIKVSVATGKVGVVDHSRKTLAMLLPAQQLSYNKLNGKVIQNVIDTDHIQSWKEGSTYLNQADFNELSIIVKNIYGLSIKAGNNKIAGYKFSLSLMRNLPSEQILELISQLHQTHFRKEGNDIVLY